MNFTYQLLKGTKINWKDTPKEFRRVYTDMHHIPLSCPYTEYDKLHKEALKLTDLLAAGEEVLIPNRWELKKSRRIAYPVYYLMVRR